MTNTINVTITGDNPRTITAHAGQLLHDVLRNDDVHIAAPCGGRGTCGKCAVLVDGVRRLSCRHELTHDITVEVPRARKASILTTTAPLSKSGGECGFGAIATDGSCESRIEGARRVIAGVDAGPYGVAIDIGTTTVVAYLEDLRAGVTLDIESLLNPQTRHGHDVVSRIHFTMENSDGLVQLGAEIKEGINGAIRELAGRNGIGLRSIVAVVVAGNNTMLHLLLGVDPAPIAQAPYTPAFTERQVRSAAELGVAINPEGVVMALPSVSAYVGADITAGIASTDMLERDDFSLFIDIGTNGEMALGNRDQLVCCSTAAGPAFEGATIHHGTGGVDGAVSRFGQDGTCETIGGLAPMGICGSGVLDIAAELVRRGVADAGGFMEKDFVVVPAAQSASGADIVFTPADIREVQLASAAIFAGVKILVREAGIEMAQVGRLYLAGGFGNYLRVESALAIGLLPASLADRIIPIGNSAGSGARLALRSSAFCDTVSAVATKARYVELSMRMDFNEEYVMSMMLERRG